jgi:hypothetical protein
MILPVKSKSNKFRKWSPNCEGPYRIEKVIPRNSYMVMSIQGTSLSMVLNGKYVKNIILVFGKMQELEND